MATRRAWRTCWLSADVGPRIEASLRLDLADTVGELEVPLPLYRARARALRCSHDSLQLWDRVESSLSERQLTRPQAALARDLRLVPPLSSPRGILPPRPTAASPVTRDAPTAAANARVGTP